jgi:mono/diheme cytochrome c family protein
MPHFRRVVAVLLAVVLATGAAVYAFASTGAGDPVKASKAERMAAGKRLYRKYCGQCHALKEARAVGFGSAKKKGPGQDGGPSFDKLRVPYNLAVLAVTTPWAGHEVIHDQMTWTQVRQTADYVATVTREHRALAQPIDG